MPQLVIDRCDISLEYATDCLIVRAEGERPRSVPLGRIDQLICLHSVTLTTQLIGQLNKRGIDLIVINQRYPERGFSLFADPARQAERRCRQYSWQLDPASRLHIARAICSHKLRSAERLLRALALPAATIAPFNDYLAAIERVNDDAALRGLEGSAQRHLFGIWRERLPASLGFHQRKRRPPPDPVNAVLSLTYTLIHHESVRCIKAVGLDPLLGFYHRLASGRASLACDLMEPLRPGIESWVVRLFTEQHLDGRYFSRSGGSCLLGKEGRQIFYSAYEAELFRWQRLLAAQARWLVHSIDRSGAA